MIRTQKVETFKAGDETWYLGELSARDMGVFLGTTLPDISATPDTDIDATSGVRSTIAAMGQLAMVVGRSAFTDENMTMLRFALPEAQGYEASCRALAILVLESAPAPVILDAGTRCLALNGLGQEARIAAAAFRDTTGNVRSIRTPPAGGDVQPSPDAIASGDAGGTGT